MTTMMQTRAVEMEAQRSAASFARESYHVRLNKVVCGLVLGVCFWFAVPYEFPLIVEHDPKIAAANEAMAYQGSRARQIAVPVIFLVAMYMLWRLPKRGRLQGNLQIVAMLYLGWAMLSVVWSGDPAISRKRLVVFAINAFFAYAMSRTFSVLEISLMGYTATGVVAMMALYVETIKLHELAPFDSDYRFMGVMTANYMAMNLVACIVCALTLMQRKPRWTVWLAPSVGLALVLLLLTRSRLSTIILMVLLVVMVLRITKARLQPVARAVVLVAGLMVVVPAMVYVVGKSGGDAAQSAFMMGRNDTENTSNLSNRAPLWSELMESVWERPWLGVGYDAFWTPSRVELVSADQGWAVPHAHNTYLDQWLSLGIVGALFYAATMLGALTVAWRRYVRHRDETSLFAAMLLTWLVLEGIAESVPLDPYLPTLLAYTCLAKMCLAEGSEAESDVWLGPEQIVGGLTPQVIEHAPETLQQEYLAAQAWHGRGSEIR